ncbi:Putative nucleoside-diphosphate-sugar epimerase [Gloeomargarita lithophora Alchichica-D10]|uniref:Nucleoside-diphosphate-sugar epimerase n=1 Tax=Gloeomargarita lithophora Alchichica-D10 TaxID=1188229 RepID=A0A1J0A9Q1_9CYAN|nr:NAD(P)H-binding protein [Gloeomargarita lithophora]APB32664.1 Putative nucleoside-diphosphate-sugar epimerase [Gloeomargarita lithophora Alchichica-D10]
MQAFVAGATGATGRRIVEELVKRDIPVRAGVRDLERGRKLLPLLVELVPLDVTNPDSLRQAVAGSTVILCATGARPSWNVAEPWAVDCCGTQNLVDVAKAQRIDQFVLVSSLCVSQLFHPLNLFWFILYWKKQAELYLQHSGLDYTIVRPGGLSNENIPGGLVIQGADSLFEGRISRQRVAQVCVEALYQPAARQKIVEIVTRPEQPWSTPESWFSQVAIACHQ